MGQNTGIEWTDHTINFWWGCFKVSPGCTHCYAETFSKRVGRHIWGPPQVTERWRTKGPWLDCRKWDKQAKAEGIRRRAFCQSMSDFFEDHPQVESWRKEAVAILESLEWLDIQLLTKRPENVLRMVPDSWLENWPRHIWIGTSVETQEYADKRIPELLKIPAVVRFLSVEPLLGAVSIRPWLPDNWAFKQTPGGHHFGIDWVIVGGESGPQARPMHPDWVRTIRDQCEAAGVAFFFKQWGEMLPYGEEESYNSGWMNREYPIIDAAGHAFYKVGKHAAGRLLDSREWNEMPVSLTKVEEKV